MPAMHEVATVTSKGQLTLPKPIRQALGVDAGGKIAFELRGAEVVVIPARGVLYVERRSTLNGRRRSSTGRGHSAS